MQLHTDIILLSYRSSPAQRGAIITGFALRAYFNWKLAAAAAAAAAAARTVETPARVFVCGQEDTLGPVFVPPKRVRLRGQAG